MFFVAFFALMSFFGLGLGYSGLIYPVVSAFSILVAFVVSFLLVRNIKVKKLGHWMVLVFVLALFLVVSLVPMYPGFVYPHACSDMMNHVLSGRTIAMDHGFNITETYFPFVYKHGYPMQYSGLTAMFYSIVPDSYLINSLLPLFFEFLSLIALFFLARNLFGEKVGILSVFIYGFSVVQLWALEQGYFPQVMGRFFLISLLYLISSKKMNVYLIFLSTIALFSYPHCAIVYFLFLLFYFAYSKNYLLFKIYFAGFLVIFFETVGLFAYYLFTGGGTVGLIRGGILVPNVLSLLIFLFALPAFFEFLRGKPYRILRCFILAVLVMMLFLSFEFIVAVFLQGKSLSLVSLYTVVKYFYLLLFPLSVLAACGIRKYCSRYPVFALFSLVLYVSYFAGYAFILPQKANFPYGFYDGVEELHTLNASEEFLVGVDESLLNNEWVQSFPYNSLVDLPDDYGACPRLEASKAFAFVWADRGYWDGEWHALDSKGREVFNVGREHVDYFISENVLDKPVFYKSGSVFVYDMRT